MARKKGKTWYVGAMTNWEGRLLTVDCSFLDEGKYLATIFSDGVNADSVARDFQMKQQTVDANDKLSIKLASGGGFVIRFDVVEQ